MSDKTKDEREIKIGKNVIHSMICLKNNKESFYKILISEKGKNNMKKKIVGMIIGMLLFIPLFATTVIADPKVDVQITGGFGIQVKITNIGNESLFDIIWHEMRTKFLNHSRSGSPGMSEPLPPGESLSYKWRPLWVPFFFNIFHAIPAINYCTFTVTVYENGGDNTVYVEKSVDALYLFGFVIILYE